MDFMVELPQTLSVKNAIWVTTDKLTTSTHFHLVTTTDTLGKLTQLYVKEIVRLYGLPKTIVSNWDMRFTTHFWKILQEAMGTTLRFSNPNHPQPDGQSERLI